MGGGGGSTTQTQKFEPPEWTKDGWQAYLNAAGVLSQRPYEQSGLPQVAPLNDQQFAAGQLASDMALYGTPMGNAANSAFMNAAQGNLANPWAGNVAGIASGQESNPWAMSVANMAQSNNPYFGNAYTDQMIADSAQNMADAFASGTAAQNDAAAAMAGAFGGSGHQQKQTADAAALAKQIGQMATSTRQAQQNTDLNAFNQQYGNQLQALGLGAGLYNTDIGNQLAANAQGGGFFNQDIANMLQGAMGGLAGNADYRQSLQGLMGAGNMLNSYQQQLLNQYNNQWQTEQGYDALMNDQYGSALSRASGTYGGSSTTGPGMSTLAGLLGLGTGAAGLYSLFSRP